jgi:hypothetical protein
MDRETGKFRPKNAPAAPSTLIKSISDLLIVSVTIAGLAAFLNAHPSGDPGLEHVVDY